MGCYGTHVKSIADMVISWSFRMGLARQKHKCFRSDIAWLGKSWKGDSAEASSIKVSTHLSKMDGALTRPRVNTVSTEKPLRRGPEAER